MFSTMNDSYLPSDHMTPILPPLHEENQAVDAFQSSLQDEDNDTPDEEGTSDWALCQTEFCSKPFKHYRTGHSRCHCHAECNYNGFYKPRNCQACMLTLDKLPMAINIKDTLRPLTAWALDFMENTYGRPAGYHFFWHHDDSVTMDICSTMPTGEMWDESDPSGTEELLYESAAGPSTSSLNLLDCQSLGSDLSPESMYNDLQFICSSFSDSSEEPSSSSEYSWAEAVSDLGTGTSHYSSCDLGIETEPECSKASSSKSASKVLQLSDSSPETIRLNIDVAKSMSSLQTTNLSTPKVTRPSYLARSGSKHSRLGKGQGSAPSLYPLSPYYEVSRARSSFSSKIPLIVQAEVHHPLPKKEETTLPLKHKDVTDSVGHLGFVEQTLDHLSGKFQPKMSYLEALGLSKVADAVGSAGHFKFVEQTLDNLSGKFQSKVSYFQNLSFSDASEVLIFIQEDSHLFPFPKTFDFFLLVGKFTPDSANAQLRTSYTPIDSTILDLEWSARQTMFDSLTILGIIEGLMVTDKDNCWSKSLQKLAKMQLQRLVGGMGTFLKARLALRKAALPGCSLVNPYVQSLLSSTPWSVGPFGAQEVSELHLSSEKLNQEVASLLKHPATTTTQSSHTDTSNP